jgi:serine/threonine protein kinase
MGSTSQVRRCRERATRREFACKVIDKSKVKDYTPVMEQFENEIEVLFKLQQMKQHPNIIRLEDVYITSTSIFMIMELMRGGELFDYVVTRGTLSEGEASTMIRKVTSAVAHMHKQGIIHRDLKPEVCLLTPPLCPACCMPNSTSSELASCMAPSSTF